MRACRGRFCFVTNSRLLNTCSFGTCSAIEAVYRTRRRIQYDDYVSPDSRSDQQIAPEHDAIGTSAYKCQFRTQREECSVHTQRHSRHRAMIADLSSASDKGEESSLSAPRKSIARTHFFQEMRWFCTHTNIKPFPDSFNGECINDNSHHNFKPSTINIQTFHSASSNIQSSQFSLCK